jgi:hypothetical protein
MRGPTQREASPVADGASAPPAVSTSLLCIGLVAGAIECFWRSARIDPDDRQETDAARRRWRLTGAALIVAALALVRRPLGLG